MRQQAIYYLGLPVHQACDRKYGHINMQIHKYKMTFFTKHGASHFSEKFMSI